MVLMMLMVLTGLTAFMTLVKAYRAYRAYGNYGGIVVLTTGKEIVTRGTYLKQKRQNKPVT